MICHSMLNNQHDWEDLSSIEPLNEQKNFLFDWSSKNDEESDDGRNLDLLTISF